MAYADYIHCAVCDTKAIYDAELDYDHSDLGEIGALCKECSEKYNLAVMDTESGTPIEVESLGIVKGTRMLYKKE